MAGLGCNNKRCCVSAKEWTDSTELPDIDQLSKNLESTQVRTLGVLDINSYPALVIPVSVPIGMDKENSLGHVLDQVNIIYTIISWLYINNQKADCIWCLVDDCLLTTDDIFSPEVGAWHENLFQYFFHLNKLQFSDLSNVYIGNYYQIYWRFLTTIYENLSVSCINDKLSDIISRNTPT